jgi:Asp-tRNA(Asn)/Glu-tRNA(Gln) amidotransferase A subunit family amidase
LTPDFPTRHRRRPTTAQPPPAVGVELVAAPWREDLLLQAAQALELAHPWAARHPAGY